MGREFYIIISLNERIFFDELCMPNGENNTKMVDERKFKSNRKFHSEKDIKGEEH